MSQALHQNQQSYGSTAGTDCDGAVPSTLQPTSGRDDASSVLGDGNADHGQAARPSSEPSAKYADAVRLSSFQRKMVFACLAANSTFAMLCISVMIPFFPQEAAKKDPDDSTGVSGASTIGFIFSITPFSEFLSAPLVGRFIPHAGPKLVVFLGGFLVSGVMLLFGFVYLIDDWSDFLVLCYALRIVQGVGTAFSVTATFAILFGMFPDNVSLVAGSIRAFHGVGFMVGPTMAGALYDSSGFTLPFLVHGSIMAAGSVWVLFALPADADVATEHKGNKMLKDTLIVPWSFVWLVSIFLYGCGMGMLDPNLSPYLEKQFGLSATEIGLVYLLFSSMAAISAPIFGYITDRYIDPRKFQALSLVLGIIGLCLVGPWQETGLSPKLWRTIVSLALIGVGLSMCLTSSTPGVLNAMHETGYEDTLELHSNLGATITACWAAGISVGPTVGSTSAGAIGFADTSAVFAAALAVACLLGLAVGGWQALRKWHRSRCGSSGASYGVAATERRTLLSSNQQATEL